MRTTDNDASISRSSSRLLRESFRIAGLTMLAPVLIVGLSSARAQDGGEQQAIEQGQTLDEIVITARRREESLQDVPMTVNAVTSEDLQQLNIRDLEDISSLVAGLTLESDDIAPSASLRGVRFDAFASGNNPTVQFYINDAPAVSKDAIQALFDVEQVEVLRGPQGTVRGRAAPSGAITLTTAKPDLERFGGYVDLTATDQEGRNIRAALNVPIIQNQLGFRLAGLYEENEGIGVDSINHRKSTEIETNGFRASLRYIPFEELTIDLMHQRLRPDRFTNPQVESANRKDPSQPPPSQRPISPSDRLGVSHRRIDNTDEIDFTTLNLNWQLNNGLALEYTGSLRSNLQERKTVDDVGAAFGPDPEPELKDLGQQLEGDSDGQTHELRLEFSASDFDYAAGFLFQNFEIENDLVQQTPVFLPEAFGGGFVTVAETPVSAPGETTEMSVYGNVTWHMSEATEISGGLRFIDFEEERTITVSGSPIVDTDDGDNALIYSLSAKHRFNDEIMAFATLGSSWRPGPNVVGNFSTEQTERERNFQNLDAETSTSFEVGIKSELLNRRLRLNGTAFYQNFDNFVYRAGGPGVYYVSTDEDGNESVEQFNFVAGVPVDVFGVEIEADYQATERWTIGGLYSWSQGLIDDGTIPCNDYFPPNGRPDRGGQEPTVQQIRDRTGGDNIAACDVDFRANFAPLWTATLQSEYTFPLFGQDLFARGLLTIFGDSKNDPTNHIDEVDRYAMLDIFAGVRDPDGRWEATLFVKNAMETERVLTRNANPASTGIVRFNPATGESESDRAVSTYRPITTTKPREFGINFRYNF